MYPSNGIELPTTFTRDPRVLKAGFVAGQNVAAEMLDVPISGLEYSNEKQRKAVKLFGKVALPKRIFALSGLETGKLFGKISLPESVIPKVVDAEILPFEKPKQKRPKVGAAALQLT
jgi:hypothetical protein